jgi:hypothetical protein
MPKILLKRNSISGKKPEISEIELGEVAINTSDGVLYTKIYKDGAYGIQSIGASELKRVENTTGTRYGWRISTENPENYLETGAFSIALNQATDSNNLTGASGDFAFSAGKDTIASGLSSSAFGLNTIAQNDSMHVVGKYNTGTAIDTIYEVGIGTDTNKRKNAFEIYTDGRVIASELTIALIDDVNTSARVLITKEYADANYSAVGSTTFVGLTDTPQDYNNAAGYAVKVNASGNALEFVDDSVTDGGQF